VKADVLSLEPDTGRMDNRSAEPDLQQGIEQATRSLIEHCRSNDWAGFDPYDALNSRLFNVTPFRYSRLCRLAFTQVLKRLPFNIRPPLLIRKEQNPKAIALFLTSFLKLSALGFSDARDYVGVMVDRLTALRSQEAPYWCWGYSFAWQTRTIIVPRGAPNLVCTVFAAEALLDAYEKTHAARYLDMAHSAGQYILNELYWTDQDGTISFSYPLQGIRSKVHNANLLGAALLCRLCRHTGYTQSLEPALKVARYSAAKQQENGAWDYGEASTQGWADNFHTGYNLSALRAIARDTKTAEFDARIKKGFEFYRANFFREDSAPKYFHDKTYPIDIHCVAQSIITLLAFGDLDKSSIDLAYSVFMWAMMNMWSDEGYFYYQVYPMYTNRISYMRWSQAWMLLALSTLLEQASAGAERRSVEKIA
jgi:hypothetical protein